MIKVCVFFLGRVEIIYSLFSIISAYDNFFRERSVSSYYDPRWLNEDRWIRIPQPRSTHVNINKPVPLRPNNINYRIKEAQSERHFRPDTFSTISETLGAINTVGRYIVNMTRGVDTSSRITEDVPGAIYTISKNVLGRNVTDSIAPLVSPLVREALPGVIIKQNPTTTEEPDDYPRSCTTPDGATGLV